MDVGNLVLLAESFLPYYDAVIRSARQLKWRKVIPLHAIQLCVLFFTGEYDCDM
jgi:hypothetical protein